MGGVPVGSRHKTRCLIKRHEVIVAIKLTAYEIFSDRKTNLKVHMAYRYFFFTMACVYVSRYYYWVSNFFIPDVATNDLISVAVTNDCR